MNMPIVPMYWWFALVEDKNLYQEYTGLAAFTRDENRHDLSPSQFDPPENHLRVYVLQGRKRTLAWAFDRDYYLTPTENLVPKLQKGIKLNLPAPAEGACQVEIWDPTAGKILSTLSLKPDKGKVTVPLPDFQRHIACKLLP